MTLALPNRVGVASYIPHTEDPIGPTTTPKKRPPQIKPKSIPQSEPQPQFQPNFQQLLLLFNPRSQGAGPASVRFSATTPGLQVSSSSIVAAGLGTSDTLIHRSSDPPIPILRSTDTDPPIHRYQSSDPPIPIHRSTVALHLRNVFHL
jgi:hypothetical protein